MRRVIQNSGLNNFGTRCASTHTSNVVDVEKFLVAGVVAVVQIKASSVAHKVDRKSYTDGASAKCVLAHVTNGIFMSFNTNTFKMLLVIVNTEHFHKMYACVFLCNDTHECGACCRSVGSAGSVCVNFCFCVSFCTGCRSNFRMSFCAGVIGRSLGVLLAGACDNDNGCFRTLAYHNAGIGAFVCGG